MEQEQKKIIYESTFYWFDRHLSIDESDRKMCDLCFKDLSKVSNLEFFARRMAIASYHMAEFIGFTVEARYKFWCDEVLRSDFQNAFVEYKQNKKSAKKS